MLNKNNLYINHLLDIRKYSSETKEISSHILEELEKQGESLVYTNKNLNESEELLNKSNKILHLMSWRGWFMSFIPFNNYVYNWYNRTSKFDNMDTKSNLLNDKNEATKEQNSINIIQNENNVNYNKNLSCNTKYLDLNSIEKEELDKLEKDINDLSYIGKQIGQHLDYHNECIDLMQKKMEILTDITKKANKKTINFL
jgi:hypothetical protein